MAISVAKNSLWRARPHLLGNKEFMATFREAWRRGSAHPFVLDDGQQEWVRARNSSTEFAVWMIARQRGKSFAAIFDDVMFCTRNDGAIVRYLGQTGESAQSILGPTLDQIFSLCPLPKMERPHPFNKQDVFGRSKEFNFPNGSVFVFSGTDNDTFRRQRGPRSSRITFDEAAFYPRLQDVEQALLPSLQTTQGSALYLSTPPLSPGHPFVDRFEAATRAGRSQVETIFSNPRLSNADIKQIIRNEAALQNQTIQAFLKSTYWRREYLAEIVLDTQLAVVPEFPEMREQIVRVSRRPEYFDLLMACDPGMDDFTGVLFAFHDFQRSKLCIEHELLLKKANTGTIAEQILLVLKTHYGANITTFSGRPSLSDYSVKPKSFVVDDSSKRICADLWAYHHLSASPAAKDDSEAAINLMRLEVSRANIEIHPRCVHLIRQLNTAIRTKPGGDMARSSKDGHYDLVATLKYLVRSWNKRSNPFPKNIGFNPHTQVRRESEASTSIIDAIFKGTSLERKK